MCVVGVVSVLCDNLNGSWWDYRVVKVCQTEQNYLRIIKWHKKIYEA